MNREANNQIDLLLRRMSGRDGAAAQGAMADDSHLDADELSSYAQNALPPAARARYTEHLADCSTCRKLITELTLSLGTAAVAAPVERMPVPGGFKKFLASLFSPLVLRYAVPALGVIVVMIVGFVVLRQQRRQETVATMNDQAKESVHITASPSPLRGFKDAEPPTADQPESVAPKSAESKAKPVAPSGEAAGAGVSAPTTIAKDDRAAADLQPSAAATPAPPAPAKAAAEPETQSSEGKKQPAEVRAKLDAEAAKQEANANEPRDEVRLVPQTAANRKYQEKPKDAPSPNTGFIGGVAGVRPGAATATRRAPDTKREEEKRGEDEKRKDADQVNEQTRTIAGRQFRKARGIWTDTAYDSSTATVNMARNSEQFRALVADEPAIGTIAKQLDGEVIVVWKGRAYHIR
jgi:hypothetical protein